MGRLIDVDEVKKRYPIMENDFGMVINESLHKELDKIPTVEAISKADMVAILDKIRAEILDEAEYAYTDFDEYKYDILHAEPDELPDDDFRYGLRRAIEIINKYKAESEE